MKILLNIVFFFGVFHIRALALDVVAAENFYGGVAQIIGGTEVHVTSILTNPNQDPHEFTTRAATAKAVADADIIIYNGLEYDMWMEKLLGTQGKAGRVVIKVADLIHAKSGDNPHIWYEPKTMLALADELHRVMSSRLATRRDFFSLNLNAFHTSMNPLFDRISVIESTSAGLTVTATEPVFGYMAQALGLKMLNGDFQIKIMNDAEPTANQTAAFEKSLTTKEAKILFYNSQVSNPTTERLQRMARLAGVPVVGISELQPPDETSYVAWMQHELDGVEAAVTAKKRGQ